MDWDRLTEVFADAVEIEPEQRATFVNLQCGDDRELRGEVQRLLKEHEHVGSFIEDPILLQDQSNGAAATFHEGDVLADRFRVIRAIGSGGMGNVYEVEDLTLGGHVAAKVLLPELTSDEQIVRQFKRGRSNSPVR